MSSWERLTTQTNSRVCSRVTTPRSPLVSPAVGSGRLDVSAAPGGAPSSRHRGRPRPAAPTWLLLPGPFAPHPALEARDCRNKRPQTGGPKTAEALLSRSPESQSRTPRCRMPCSRRGLRGGPSGLRRASLGVFTGPLLSTVSLQAQLSLATARPEWQPRVQLPNLLPPARSRLLPGHCLVRPRLAPVSQR